MQFTIATIAAFAGAAAALNSTSVASPVYVTEVVTHLTTYCPEATVLSLGSKTITVTAATTLTVEDCSCTLTHTSFPAAAATSAATTAPVVTAPYNNGTTAAPTTMVGTVSGAAHASGSASTTKPAAFTGAASNLNAAAAAAAAFGLAALAL